MDPISTAIVAAVAAGATGGAKKVAEKAVVESYHALKDVLKRIFGKESELVQSVAQLEARPDSSARKDVLEEEVTTSQADQHPEALQAAQTLLDQLKSQPGGEQIIQQAIGNYNAQASGGSTATVNVNRPEELE